MKKLILLSAIIAVMISCSDDDKPSQDPIIGTWNPIKTTYVYEDGSEDIYTLSECEVQSTFTFLVDGSMSSISQDDDLDGTCIPTESEFMNQTWEKTEGGLYVLKGILIEDGSSYSETYFAKFSNKNKIMILYTDNPDEAESYSYIEFKKVN